MRAIDGAHARGRRRRQDEHLVADRDAARSDLPGKSSVVEIGAQNDLHREAEVRHVAAGVTGHALEEGEQGGPVVPRRAGARLHDVVAFERAHREVVHLLEAHLLRHLREGLLHLAEDLGLVVDQVHLVHRHGQMRDAEQRGDEGVALGLLQHAQARVDQDDGHRRRRGARRHIARVLHVPGRVGEDELALLRREVAVGDVDGDALLTLGAQAVGEEREVDLAVRDGRGFAHRLELVGKNALGIVQQATDEGGFAVVDRTDEDEAQQLLLLFVRQVVEHLGFWPAHLRNTLRASCAPSIRLRRSR